MSGKSKRGEDTQAGGEMTTLHLKESFPAGWRWVFFKRGFGTQAGAMSPWQGKSETLVQLTNYQNYRKLGLIGQTP